MRMRVFTLVALLCAMSGCGDELTPASLIEGPRVIGARAVMEADATRAWPEPGEEARVEFVVVDAGPTPPLTWGFLACALAERSFGIDECSGDPLALALQLTAPDAAAGEDPDPHIDLRVPEEATAESSVLVLGAICFSGTPNMDFDTEQPCEGEGASGTLVTFVVPVGDAANTNTHPELDIVRLDGEDWTYAPPRDAPLEGCAGAADVPQIRRSAQAIHEIQIVANAASFESYEAESGDPPMMVTQSEELQVSLFSTLGELEGLYAFAEAGEAEMSVEWEPAQLVAGADAGQLVRFNFVARDGRAGLSVISRGVCITP